MSRSARRRVLVAVLSSTLAEGLIFGLQPPLMDAWPVHGLPFLLSGAPGVLPGVLLGGLIVRMRRR